MEAVAAKLGARNEGPDEKGGIAAELKAFGHRVDEISTTVDKLEQRLTDVEQFYLAANRNQLQCSSSVLDIEKRIANIKKQQQDASRREAAAATRMQKLIGQFARILRQITRDEWAWPFMHPVDVEALGLHDYYEVIKKPMDFTRIKNQMEAKDGTGYKNIRDAYADVRLVFNNAMKYNDEKSDVYMMAKTLLAKFEEKWQQLLPRVYEEEKRREEEVADGESDMQLVQEAVHAKRARDISNELFEVDKHLEQLREMVFQKCRKMSTEDKRKLFTALTELSPEDLNKALEIVAQNNPCFQGMAEEVDLDIDAQSVSTLWKLKLFVKGALDVQGKNSGSMVGHNNHKRKIEICDDPAKTSKKLNRNLPS